MLVKHSGDRKEFRCARFNHLRVKRAAGLGDGNDPFTVSARFCAFVGGLWRFGSVRNRHGKASNRPLQATGSNLP